MAVAIKELGFTNIEIYNGGLKDWLKNDLEVESIDPLPAVSTPFITNEELLRKIKAAKKENCPTGTGNNILTLIDFRSSLRLKKKKGGDQYRIKTKCRTITTLLDDFLNNRELLNSLPKDGMVVTVSETGNRDQFLMRYLYKHGYTNVAGLQYGMRGWLKADYPVDKLPE